MWRELASGEKTKHLLLLDRLVWAEANCPTNISNAKAFARLCVVDWSLRVGIYHLHNVDAKQRAGLKIITKDISLLFS